MYLHETAWVRRAEQDVALGRHPVWGTVRDREILVQHRGMDAHFPALSLV